MNADMIKGQRGKKRAMIDTFFRGYGRTAASAPPYDAVSGVLASIETGDLARRDDPLSTQAPDHLD